MNPILYTQYHEDWQKITKSKLRVFTQRSNDLPRQYILKPSKHWEQCENLVLSSTLNNHTQIIALAVRKKILFSNFYSLYLLFTLCDNLKNFHCIWRIVKHWLLVFMVCMHYVWTNWMIFWFDHPITMNLFIYWCV